MGAVSKEDGVSRTDWGVSHRLLWGLCGRQTTLWEDTTHGLQVSAVNGDNNGFDSEWLTPQGSPVSCPSTDTLLQGTMLCCQKLLGNWGDISVLKK